MCIFLKMDYIINIFYTACFLSCYTIEALPFSTESETVQLIKKVSLIHVTEMGQTLCCVLGTQGDNRVTRSLTSRNLQSGYCSLQKIHSFKKNRRQKIIHNVLYKTTTAHILVNFLMILLLCIKYYFQCGSDVDMLMQYVQFGEKNW